MVTHLTCYDRILELFGGIYLDEDVFNVKSLPTDIKAPNGFMIPPWSQATIPCIGNDIIFAVPGSTIMRTISDLAQQSYLNIIDDQDRTPSYSLYQALSRKAAIVQTGPQFIRKALKVLGYLKHEIGENKKTEDLIRDLAEAKLLYHPETVPSGDNHFMAEFHEFKIPGRIASFNAHVTRN